MFRHQQYSKFNSRASGGGEGPSGSCHPWRLGLGHKSNSQTSIPLASTVDAASKTKLLRDVDHFVMSLPLGDAPGDVEIEEAVTQKLFNIEAARLEAQNRTKEWMAVAEELKEIVQLQQRQLEAAKSGKRGAQQTTAAAHPPAKHYAGRAHSNSKFADLHQLLDVMRADLKLTSINSYTPPTQGSDSAPIPSEIEALYAELHSLRKQVHGQQQEERAQCAHGDRQVEVHLESQLAEAHKAHKKSRKALLEAEMELQRAGDEATELHRRVAMLEDEVQGKNRQIEAMQAELTSVSQRNQTIESEQCNLEGQIESLQAECSHKDAQLQATKQTVDRSMAALQEAEGRAAAAESSAAAERQRRAATETTVADLQARIEEYERAAVAQTRKMHEEVTALSAQADAMQAELENAQLTAHHAQAHAAALRHETSDLRKALGNAQAEVQDYQEKLDAAHTDIEFLTQRVQRAESQVGVPPAALAEANRNHELEIRALREVLDTVTAAAREKDTQMEVISNQKEQAMVSKNAVSVAWRDRYDLICRRLQATEQRLEATQSAAAAEFETWDRQLKEAINARDDMQCKVVELEKEIDELQMCSGINGSNRPVVLRIAVNDDAASPANTGHTTTTQEDGGVVASIEELKQQHASQLATMKEQHELLRRRAAFLQSRLDALMEDGAVIWRQGDPLPAPIMEQLDDYFMPRNGPIPMELEEVEAQWEQRVEGLKAQHAAALEAAEMQHLADIDSALKAVELANGHLKQHQQQGSSPEEVSRLREAWHQAQARVRTVEGELLVAQKSAAQLNSVIGKLEAKAKRYKDLGAQLEGQTQRAEEAEALVAQLNQRLEEVEGELASVRLDLGDARDEVEALLTQRLETLMGGAPPTQPHGEGQQASMQFYEQQQQHEHHPDVDEDAYQEEAGGGVAPRPESPLKKLSKMMMKGLKGRKATPHPKKLMSRLPIDDDLDGEQQDPAAADDHVGYEGYSDGDGGVENIGALANQPSSEEINAQEWEALQRWEEKRARQQAMQDQGASFFVSDMKRKMGSGPEGGGHRENSPEEESWNLPVGMAHNDMYTSNAGYLYQ